MFGKTNTLKKALFRKKNKTVKSDEDRIGRNAVEILIKNWPTYAGFFLVSMAVLSYEVVINRMFSLTYWYHFAFMIISVALFGIGFGGLLVFFTNKFFKNDSPIVLAVLSIAMAFSFPLVLLKVNTIPLIMDQLGKDPAQSQLFIQVFLTLSIPFIISGFIFSFVFTNFKKDINRIYFFDLFGGGVGCIFALIVFVGRGPFLTSFILSILVIVAAGLFAFKRSKMLGIILIPAAIFALYFFVTPKSLEQDVRLAKGVRIVEIDKEGHGQQYEAIYGKLFYSFWDNFGFVTVHSSTKGIAHSVDESGEGKYAIYSDYSCTTPLMEIDKKRDIRTYNFKYFTEHDYPYVIKKDPGVVGIVGVGGGKDVIQALARGAKEVYGAEFNTTVYNLFSHVYDDLLGNISRQTNVHIANEEGRFFLRSNKRKYDIIVFDNAVSQAAVSSGAFTLAESYLFTTEAMEDYFKHLNTNGVIYFSGPVTDATRFATGLRETFRRYHTNLNITNSIVIADNRSTAYDKCKVLVKNGTFTKEEVDTLINYAAKAGHAILYAPYHDFKSTSARLLTTTNIEAEYQTSTEEIRPSTDDWPFFTQRQKPESETISARVQNAMHFRPEPFLMLRQAAMQISIFAFLFLLVPLIVLNLKGFSEMKNKLGSVVYFSSLGLGFMLLEIVLIQKYQLVLGHPIYSFSIVLAGLLISSGVGSLVSEKIKDPYKAILYGVAGMIAATAVSYLFSRFITPFVTGFPFAVRVIIILILVSMNGFFMGFLMPSGIRAVSKVEESIPWMWSINSVFSVLASFLAIYFSILFGFTFVMAGAVLIYIAGALFFVIRRV